MKRKGKCAGKRAYSHRSKACQAIINNYVLGFDSLGLYECPTCLDFHLTHLYDNRTPKLIKHCKRALNEAVRKEGWRVPTHVLIAQRAI